MSEINAGADYNVKVTVRNGLLLSKIRAAGYASIHEFCQAKGLSSALVRALINLKISGMKRIAPQWRSIVILVADALQCMPQDIIPPQHWNDALSTNNFELSMTASDAAALVSRSPMPEDNLIRSEVEKVVRSKIATLPVRLQKVVRLRHGITKTAYGHGHECTLEEVGRVLGVSTGRAQQMEHKAYQLMMPKDRNEQRALRSYIRDLVKLDETS